MRRSLLTVSLIVLGGALAHAASSRIPDKLTKMVDQLLEGYASKRTDGQRANLAIFEFNCNERLAKQRTGFAVSELMLHQFAKEPRFTVVERSALRMILEEQSLQRTGAVDSETAVKVGKLAGAQVLLLGSIDKLGSVYQATARLVDAESGQVIVVAYQEFEAAAFEDEANPYLRLVPRSQKVGIYLLMNVRYNPNNLPVQRTLRIENDGGGDIATQNDISPRPFPLALLGIGFRYFPAQNWMADVSAGMLTNKVTVADDLMIISRPSFGGSTRAPGQRKLTSALVVRATWNRVFPSTSLFDGILGIGAATYAIGIDGFSFPTMVTPSVRVGFDYHPQERFHLGLFFNYDLLYQQARDRVSPGPGATRLDGWSLEPTVGFYF